eukprot:3480127-Rhodomonas_salina.2
MEPRIAAKRFAREVVWVAAWGISWNPVVPTLAAWDWRLGRPVEGAQSVQLYMPIRYAGTGKSCLLSRGTDTTYH